MKKFEKHLDVSTLIMDMLKKVWIVIAVVALVFLAEVVVMKLRQSTSPEIGTEKQYTTQLINGDYVYSYSMIVHNGGIQPGTYISLTISSEVINPVINELGLKEAYTDMNSRFTWGIYGDAVNLLFSTPTETAIGGEDWIDVLTHVQNRTIEKIKEIYPTANITIIDTPFLINAKKIVEVSNSNNGISKKYPLLAGIFAMLVILVIYVLNMNIVHPIEIEENMSIPVLAELPKQNVCEMVNIMANNITEWNQVAFATLGKSNQGKNVIDQCIDDINRRFEKINVSSEDDGADIVLVDAGLVGANDNSTYLTGKCKKTIIVVENNKVNGDKALKAVNNMKMNGANVVGAIYVW